jgi:ubiquitin-protein ligase
MNPRLRRLENDYQEIRRRFDGDSSVEVLPLGTVPPQQYQIIYRVPSLRINVNNSPVMVPQTIINLSLPAGYPREKPNAVAIDPVFHPNFGNYVCIADFWSPAQSLSDIIVLMGDMLQWKKFNIRSPLNAVAAEWAVEHASEIPIGNVELGVIDTALEIKIF